MNRHTEHATHRSWEPPFIELMAPTYAVAEGILAGFSGLREWIALGFKSWERKHRIDRTIAALSRLEDHVLRDIGIRREDIYAVAHFVVDEPDADVRDLVNR